MQRVQRTWWTKNVGVRTGAVAAAVLATAGFYALVETNPPRHAASANAASATDAAPANPLPISVRQGLPGGAAGAVPSQSQSSVPPQSQISEPASGSSGSVASAPAVRPHTRSRGS